MNNILVISEDTIRTNSELSKNLWSKSLLPAIRTAQDIYLQEFLGSCLYNKILTLISSNTVSDQGNEQYKQLLDDHITPYMIERVVADVIPIVGSKVVNMGVIKSTDEHTQTVSADEVDRIAQLHINKADHYAKRMQHYLKANSELFPELDCGNCGDVKPTLDSAADSGIFLGGFRGKRVR